MHEYLEEKHYGERGHPCPRCGSDHRELDLTPPRIARGRRPAHGGKIGWRCGKCGWFQAMVLRKNRAL